MGNVDKVTQYVSKLTREELAAFREWFRRYDSDAWDRQIEDDVRAGKLDKLAEEAVTGHKAGKSKEL